MLLHRNTLLVCLRFLNVSCLTTHEMDHKFNGIAVYLFLGKFNQPRSKKRYRSLILADNCSST